MTKDKLKIKNLLNKIKEEQRLKESHPVPTEIPFHEIPLYDRVVYEKNINYVLQMLITLEKNNQLHKIENNLKFKLFLTAEEKALKAKIDYYRKCQNNKDILNADKQWVNKQKTLKLAGIGLFAILTVLKMNMIPKISELYSKRQAKENILIDNRAFIIVVKDILKSMINKNIINHNPKDKVISSKLFSDIMRGFKQNQNVLIDNIMKVKDPNLRKSLMENHYVIKDYIIDNPAKVKKILHHIDHEIHLDNKNSIQISNKKNKRRFRH